MSRRVIKSPQAVRDLSDHYQFIARDKFDPAERFLLVAEDAFERLAAMPGIGREWQTPAPHLQSIRVYPMPSGFRNYLIFYRVTDDGIEVLTIIHGARDLDAALNDLLDES